MIKVDYDKKSGKLEIGMKGDSDNLLFELNIILNKLLEAFHTHDQEILVLDEITDVVSKFAEEHTPNKKRRKER